MKPLECARDRRDARLVVEPAGPIPDYRRAQLHKAVMAVIEERRDAESACARARHDYDMLRAQTTAVEVSSSEYLSELSKILNRDVLG